MCDQGAALGFEVGDYKLLAEHIANVITDKALSDELIRCARAYRRPHAMENAIPFYEDLIRKVVSSPGRVAKFLYQNHDTGCARRFKPCSGVGGALPIRYCSH